MLNYQRNPTDFLYDRIVENKVGCWEYQGVIQSNGYGSVAFAHQRRSAHRLSWMIYNGPIPDGKYICHHCDNKRCINPKHLYCGTHADNMMDVTTRKRHPTICPTIMVQKITPEQREKIKDLYMAYGMRVQTLSRIYGICRGSIYDIVKGKTHKRFLQAHP